MEKFKSFIVYVLSVLLITHVFYYKPIAYVVSMVIATLAYLAYILNEE